MFNNNNDGFPLQGLLGAALGVLGSYLLGNNGFLSNQNISNAPRVLSSNNNPTITIGTGNGRGLNIFGNNLEYNNHSSGHPIRLSNHSFSHQGGFGFGRRGYDHHETGTTGLSINVTDNGIEINTGGNHNPYSTTNPHHYGTNNYLWGSGNNSLSISFV